MMKKSAALTALSGLSLALAACGNDPEDVDVVETEPIAGETLVLTPAQQANFDAFDRDAFNTEYRTLRDAIRVEGQTQGQASGTSSTSGSTPAADGQETTAATSTSGGGGLRSREAMDFEWLDRNDDGRLSVAEYAIWKIPVDPNEPKPNDETKPYLTQDQINEAGRSFFYYDQDGNTYLSQAEFASARAGTGSAAT